MRLGGSGAVKIIKEAPGSATNSAFISYNFLKNINENVYTKKGVFINIPHLPYNLCGILSNFTMAKTRVNVCKYSPKTA